MNEEESWKLQNKMAKARSRDKNRKDTWWYSPLSREWQIRNTYEDVDVDPPDEYNRAIEGEDEC